MCALPLCLPLSLLARFQREPAFVEASSLTQVFSHLSNIPSPLSSYSTFNSLVSPQQTASYHHSLYILSLSLTPAPSIAYKKL